MSYEYGAWMCDYVWIILWYVIDSPRPTSNDILADLLWISGMDGKFDSIVWDERNYFVML